MGIGKEKEDAEITGVGMNVRGGCEALSRPCRLAQHWLWRCVDLREASGTPGS